MNKNKKLSRRSFLKAGTTAGAAAMLAPAAIGMLSKSAAAAANDYGPGNLFPGRVVLNYNDTHGGNALGGNATAQTVIKKMVDDAILLLTGQATVAEAWRSLFPSALTTPPKIAIKINLLNSTVPSHPFVVMGITEGLQKMVFGTTAMPAANITIYDGCNGTTFSNAGFTTVRFPNINFIHYGAASSNPTVYPYEKTTQYTDGAAGKNYAPALHDADYLINVPGIRGHGVDGACTLGFKSHFGTYNACGTYSNASTYLRDINCTGPVHAKLLLTVFAGIFGLRLENGPTGGADNYIYYAKKKNPNLAASVSGPNTVIMSTDPVTAEYQAIKIMRIQGTLSGSTWTHDLPYTITSMPSWLKAAGGVTGALTPTYNIGVLDEAQQSVGEIINGTIVSTGIETPDVAGIGKEVGFGVRPNPANLTAHFDFYAPDKMAGKMGLLEIFDAQGRLVWKSDVTVLGRRNHAVWDGRTRSGKAATTGRYVAHLTLGSDALSTAFTLVR